MTTGPRVGILGGTLDPMHLGHLETALAVRGALDLDRVIVMPSHLPPHRPQRPSASTYHRFAMAALTVNGHERLLVSDDELCASGLSYTADTLERLRARGLDRSQIFFIVGGDAFAEIDTWHRYPAVLDLAHFVVVSRPGFPVSRLPAQMPHLAERLIPAALAPAFASQPRVFTVDARTPDVSSTEVRRRARAGESLKGLVARVVEGHILQHGLYQEASDDSYRPHAADHLHGED
jgi:nicotinate-nucleotide adenylyltransferase